jgi:hypothetical protein
MILPPEETPKNLSTHRGRRLRPAPFSATLTPMEANETPDLAALIEELSPQADSGNAIFIAALLEDSNAFAHVYAYDLKHSRFTTLR